MITLVLGGARSGKSEVAEGLAARWGATPSEAASDDRRRVAGPAKVAYLATGVPDPGDLAWAERIAAHRARRPPDWDTVEVGAGGDLAQEMAAAGAAVLLVDSLGAWLAGRSRFDPDLDRLVQALRTRAAAEHQTIIVSDEVGLGVHPSTEIGRAFRDALGKLNRQLAEVADEVLLVVAGRVLALPPGEPRSESAPCDAVGQRQEKNL